MSRKCKADELLVKGQCVKACIVSNGSTHFPPNMPRIKKDDGHYITFTNGDTVFYSDFYGLWAAYDNQTKYTRKMSINGKAIIDPNDKAQAIHEYYEDYNRKYGKSTSPSIS